MVNLIYLRKEFKGAYYTCNLSILRIWDVTHRVGHWYLMDLAI